MPSGAARTRGRPLPLLRARTQLGGGALTPTSRMPSTAAAYCPRNVDSAGGAVVAVAWGAGGPILNVCEDIKHSPLPPRYRHRPRHQTKAGKAKGGGAMRARRARGLPKARPPALTLAWRRAGAAGTATRTAVRTRGGRGAAVVIGPRGVGDSERSHAAQGADGESAAQSHCTERNNRARAVKWDL